MGGARRDVQRIASLKPDRWLPFELIFEGAAVNHVSDFDPIKRSPRVALVSRRSLLCMRTSLSVLKTGRNPNHIAFIADQSNPYV